MAAASLSATGRDCPPDTIEENPQPCHSLNQQTEEEKQEEFEDDQSEEEFFVYPPYPWSRNPLDELPKSAFNLEEWKRQYSNLDTRQEALPWFYDRFDHEGFSVWRVDYKHNDELTHIFMSCNQIGGFFNRLEASRKYIFGSMGVFGKANDSIITGAVIVRGKDFKPVISVAPDWELYAYEQIDLSRPKHREFFEGALARDLVIDGKGFADGKVLK